MRLTLTFGTSAAFVSGTGRATWHHALWTPSARGRHLLRLRPNSLRGGSARLRRLCVRPQPGRMHADLGRIAISWAIRRTAPSWHGAKGTRRKRCRRKSIRSASKPTVKAGVLKHIFTAWRLAARKRLDGSAAPITDRQLREGRPLPQLMPDPRSEAIRDRNSLRSFHRGNSQRPPKVRLAARVGSARRT